METETLKWIVFAFLAIGAVGGWILWGMIVAELLKR